MPIRSILLATMIAALVALTAPAMSAGSTFVHHGSIFAFPSVYGFSKGQGFEVDLEQGDTISASLEWTSGATDLDLLIFPPSAICELAPEPDVPCSVASVGRRTACSDRPKGGMLLDTSGYEAWSYTVPVSGTWKIIVQAGLSVEPRKIPYVLAVDIDGAGNTSSIHLAEELRYVAGISHCRVI